ncbi:glutamate--cysteine ligase [Haloarchaeobius sp. DFWS5]|uniref:glutamate--cysteine ligase n=1 Tax=Haloarchaeobius sp. DFWS5 TaxID=3446114 RepID=UPI003EC10F00
MHTGIELELWVVDDQGQLCDGHGITDAYEWFEPEFVAPLVEVQTAPHTHEAPLRRDLTQTLWRAIDEAAAANKHLVPLGTPLTPTDRPAASERGELFETIYGEGVQSAKNCAGTHLHFEKGNVTRQLNLLTALDPALALVNSSPYYCGSSGQRSSRALAYRQKCGADFEEFCDLWGYVDSVDEWTARVQRAYQTFESLAADRGVSTETVAEYFCPEDTVLNPVRLRHEQPTVEWRAPDAALPSQVLRLASDVGDLVAQTDEKPLDVGTPGIMASSIGIPTFETLRERSDEAIRDGLESGAVRNYLTEMGFAVDEYDPIASQMHRPDELTDDAACEIRLAYAKRLREDVANLAKEFVDPGQPAVPRSETPP